MAFARPNGKLILAAVLSLCGCYAPIQQVPMDGIQAVRIMPDRPATVRIDRDSTVTYARIRVAGDSLYGWEYQGKRVRQDSVAIALGRIRGIEQHRLEIAQTASAIFAGVAGMAAVAVVVLLILLQSDHS